MISVRRLNASRPVRVITAILVIGGAAAFVLRLATRVRDGRGLEPYWTAWGLETTPVQALTGLAFALLVLGIAELVVWLRATTRASRRPPRRARGPLRSRPGASRFPF